MYIIDILNHLKIPVERLRPDTHTHAIIHTHIYMMFHRNMYNKLYTVH